MHVAALSLHEFRSYPQWEGTLAPGATTFLGSNGQGKTNLVEAIDYVSRLRSHRVSSDAPLVRRGAHQAVVRTVVVKDGRRAELEVEINPGRANRARINRSPLPRPREIVGLLRTVLFSPEDLALVKGDPSERRRFLDDLMVLRTPRLAGVRADYDRVLRQRNTLLKNNAARRSARGEDPYLDATLAVWDEQLVTLGGELVLARDSLVTALMPLLGECYAAVAKDAVRTEATARYLPAVLAGAVGEDGDDGPAGDTPATGAPVDLREGLADLAAVRASFTAALAARAQEERRRGLTLVGPHRDEVAFAVGDLPVKGYASHGESWSFALALRLAAYHLLRSDGEDPVLILDDVFAELDADRRERLAELVAPAEQVLVTAAVASDVPAALHGERVEVRRVAS